MHPQRREALHTLVRYTTHIYHIEATCSPTDRRENTKLGGIYNPTRATVKNISRWTFVFRGGGQTFTLSVAQGSKHTVDKLSESTHLWKDYNNCVYIPAGKAHTCDILTW